jgi:hypothetical protein
MATKKYYRQKLKGSRLIVERIKEIAEKSNIKIAKIEWDEGKLSTNRKDFHILKIYTDNSAIQKTFYDEELVDFPYDGADTVQKIQGMVKELN